MVHRVGIRPKPEYEGGAPPGAVVIPSVCRHRDTLVTYHEGVIYISYPMCGTTFSCSVADVWQLTSLPKLVTDLPDDIALLIGEFIGIPMGYAFSVLYTGPDVYRCFLNSSSSVYYNPYFPATKCVYDRKQSGTSYICEKDHSTFFLTFPRLSNPDGTRNAVFVYRESWLRFKIPDGFMTKRKAPPPPEKCSICMVNEKTVAFSPCGHVWCAECAHMVQSCPTCRANITSRLRLYK